MSSLFLGSEKRKDWINVDMITSKIWFKLSATRQEVEPLTHFCLRELESNARSSAAKESHAKYDGKLERNNGKSTLSQVRINAGNSRLRDCLGKG